MKWKEELIHSRPHEVIKGFGQDSCSGTGAETPHNIALRPSTVRHYDLLPVGKVILEDRGVSLKNKYYLTLLEKSRPLPRP